MIKSCLQPWKKNPCNINIMTVYSIFYADFVFLRAVPGGFDHYILNPHVFLVPTCHFLQIGSLLLPAGS